MKALGNKIYIQKGENFALRFGAHDCAPIVLSASMKYPFVVVTLRSTQYKQENQYVSTRWLDCKYVPTFFNSNITHLGVGTMNSVSLPPDDDDGNERVYSVADKDGNLTYFYYDGEDRIEYSFTFTVNYDADESNEFTDREYIGEVHLIDGETVATYLKELCHKYNLTLSNDSMINAYDALLNINAVELKEAMLNVPIQTFTSKTLLLKFNLFVEV